MASENWCFLPFAPLDFRRKPEPGTLHSSTLHRVRHKYEPH